MSELQSRLQAAVGDTYRIEKELGGGGMSRVFLAEEVELGRRVVIKVLPPEMAAGVNQERFRREIQLAAKLQHPHVVPLLTAGSHDDLLYYMMPFIEGESLRTKLAREGELPVGDAVRILKEVVDALAYAHRNQVVHRDIKPDNVLLSEGHAVVTDFGVAKAVSASTGESSLTSLGVALGTPTYMAPEQAVADPHVDHRADIYAVGAMAYEMLTGRPPFSGPNPQAVLSAHVTDAPDPATKHRTTVPDVLNSLVMRCLEKKAADRWQKADELLPHLDAILTPSGGITPTGTQPVAALDYTAAARRAHPVRVAALFGLASVGVLALVYLITRQLGLPDWVFYGAILLLAIGLPIMVLTGQRERRRAIAQTTGMHVTTPVGLERHFTWRKAILGGGLAFTGLAVVAGGYMAMRTLGIGPVGTLVATGALEERDRIIVADFEDRTGDVELGTSVTEALRIDLSQSPVVRVMEAAEIGGVLRRMSRDPGAVLDADLAREVAEREGIKAVLTGDIGRLGSGYVVSARLASGTDGSVLVGLRETADDEAGIIGAVDRLSSKLRERIGESLRSIRATPPLGRVSTASLDALRMYSQALRADAEGQIERAVLLFDEAIALDTAFAMAHRALAEVLGSIGAEIPRVLESATKAFEYRDNLPSFERYLAEAFYYTRVELDRSRAAAAYRSALEARPADVTTLSELATLANNTRRWEEAESWALQAMPLTTGWQPHVYGTRAQMAQGKVAEAQETVDLFDSKAPGNPDVLTLRIRMAAAQRDYETALEYLQQLDQVMDDPFWNATVAFLGYTIHYVRGELGAATRSVERERVATAGRNDAGPYLDATLNLAYVELSLRQNPTAAINIVDAALSRFPLDSIALVARPYPALVEFYARAGEVDRAKQLLDEYNAVVSEQRRRFAPLRHGAAAEIARAEGRLPAAIDRYHAWHEETGQCVTCGLFGMAQTYDLLGNADSAIALFERAVDAPALDKIYQEFWALATTYRRLGELYEQRGDTAKALENFNNFVELWNDADEELQSQVQDVRERIARLVGEQ